MADARPPARGERAGRLRPIDPASEDEVGLVAARMRDTLVEVEGEARGGAMYTLDWLADRVRWHLDPARRGRVLLAEDDGGRVVGHVLCRIEPPGPHDLGDGVPYGLVTTTYVVPEARRQGWARRCLDAAEDWFRAQGVDRACTWTSSTNERLIALYRAAGYHIDEQGPNDLTGTLMVRLARRLEPSAGEAAAGPTTSEDMT